MRIIILSLLLFINSYSFSDEKDEAEITKLIGTYKITGYEQYGGGLTDDEYAKKMVGTPVIIAKNTFEVRGDVVKNPIYKLEKIVIYKEEGNIPPKDLSIFYGYQDDRNFVKRLAIYKNTNDKDPYNYIEILDNGKFLEMYDGRFYFIK